MEGYRNRGGDGTRRGTLVTAGTAPGRGSLNRSHAAPAMQCRGPDHDHVPRLGMREVIATRKRPPACLSWRAERFGSPSEGPRACRRSNREILNVGKQVASRRDRPASRSAPLMEPASPNDGRQSNARRRCATKVRHPSVTRGTLGPVDRRANPTYSFAASTPRGGYHNGDNH